MLSWVDRGMGVSVGVEVDSGVGVSVGGTGVGVFVGRGVSVGSCVAEEVSVGIIAVGEIVAVGLIDGTKIRQATRAKITGSKTRERGLTCIEYLSCYWLLIECPLVVKKSCA